MNEEHFLTQPSKDIEQNYSGKLLNIIHTDSERRKQIRTLESKMGDPLNNELHEQRFYDARAEMESCEPVRKEIAESFGITLDDEHVVFYPPPRATKRSESTKSLSCFCHTKRCDFGRIFLRRRKNCAQFIIENVDRKIQNSIW